MISFRIKFDNIISELYMPERKNGVAVIFLQGLPSFLYKNSITRKLTERGCTVYQPYYSGTYDSDGDFSPSQSVRDVDTFVKMVQQNSHKELYFNKDLDTGIQKIVLMGTSFGSSIVALTNNKDIDKKIFLSPVLIYNQKDISRYSEGLNFQEQMTGLLRLVKNGYPHVYRISNLGEWEEFLFGKSDGLILEQLKNDGVDRVFIQGEGDTSVPVTLNQKFIKENEITGDFLVDKTASHSISSYSGKTINFIADEAIKLINDDNE